MTEAADDTRAWNTAADATRGARSLADLEMVEGTHEALDLLTAKWKVDIVYLLASGARRYSRLHEQLPVSKKVLTHTLRSLERDGMVERRVFAEVPSRVEYSLTPLGWSLTEILMALYEWSTAHHEQVEVARRSYEAGAEVAHLSLAPRPAGSP